MKNVLTPVSTAHQMVDCSFVLNSELTQHRPRASKLATLCQ